MKRKSLKTMAMCIIAAAGFLACKPGNAPEEPKYEYDVYVVGEEGELGELAAMLWKNGEATVLADKSKNAQAHSVFVDKEDVYVAIQERVKAVLWKNGKTTELEDGAIPHSVFVANGKVYTAGHRVPEKNYTIAMLWKNGEAIKLTDGKEWSAAWSVFVDKDDVYVAGYKGSKALLWKNGEASELSDGSKWTVARSVYVSDGDVYVAGWEKKGEKNVAKLWKNGKATEQSDGKEDAAAFAVFVADGNVYVAGYEKEGDKQVAKLWKNGEATALTNGKREAVARSVFVIDGKVYVAGWEDGKATLWEDGVATKLSDGPNHLSGYGNISVYVVRREAGKK